jgi:hypothetical protein
MSYPAGILGGMKLLRLLVPLRFDPVRPVPAALRLPPPGSLRVIEGATGAGRKPAVRFSVRLRRA